MSYNSNATDLAYKFIEKKIKSGEWKPGMKIDTEASLCEQLGVSRIAVRQSIEKLAAMSVLKKVHGSGTYVEYFENTSILGIPFYVNKKEVISHILEFGKMFDSYNAELFIQKCTASDLRRLEENYKNMVNAAHNFNEFQKYDNEFHHIIASCTYNPIIVQISILLQTAFSSDQDIFMKSDKINKSIEYHGLILNAILKKNYELAGIYSKMHVEAAINELEKLSAFELEE